MDLVRYGEACRKRKGLHGCIKRVQDFIVRNKGGYAWKVDIKKFFDNVDQKKLIKILSRRLKNETDLKIVKEIIGSYSEWNKFDFRIFEILFP